MAHLACLPLLLVVIADAAHLPIPGMVRTLEFTVP